MKTLDIIKQTAGKIFTVTFTKADGSIRVLNGRLGVTKHLKGGKCTLDPNKYVIIYDLQKKGYRAVNVNSILSVVVDGVESKPVLKGA